jgi:uncharacterized protein YutE (UPF0331/DUF86 family)
MSKNTVQKIFNKFHLLDKYLSYLKALQKEIKSEKEFLKDFHLFGLAERYLQLSCQAIIDILDLIVIEENLEKPDSRMEEISLLYNSGIISEKMARKLEDIVKFRNILVHEYGEIDERKVYKNLFSKTRDFEEFKKEILKWIKKSQKKLKRD